MNMEQEPTGIMGYFIKLIHQLRSIITNSDFVFTELYSGVTVLLWGLWVANPYYNTYNTSYLFQGLARLPLLEDVQGLLVALLGLAQLLVLFFGSMHVRKVASFSIVLLWLFISVMFVRANPASTATVIYPMLTLAAIWAYWRITVLGK